jgi:hypothetical protein
MTIFQAKINLPQGAVLPDEYDIDLGRIPSDGFVISRNNDGSTLSTYGQLSWDRTPYEPDGRTVKLHFVFWGKGKLTQQRVDLVAELHWLMFIMMYLRPGRPLSNATYKYYLYSMHVIARLCDSRSIKIQDFLSNPRLLLESANNIEYWSYYWSRIIKLLHKLGPDVVGFNVAKKEIAPKLDAISQAYNKKQKQHPPIPTRIYSSILLSLKQDLQEFEQVADRILGLYRECTNDFLSGRTTSQQSIIRKDTAQEYGGIRPEFAELLKKYNLENYWAKKGYVKTVWGLSSAITSMMVTASLQIEAFTGMRTNEVQSLPHHCLDIVERNGSDHYIVKGRVTKHSGGLRKRTRWVTSESGKRAILLMQRFSEAIYKSRGKIPVKSDTRINSYYLFISPSYGLFANWRHAPATLELSSYTQIRKRYQPAIDEEDLIELEQIDPHRAWRSESEFQHGLPWPLKTHQLRRSLALYAQRSGLVSLPTLKRQLQHITAEMVTYYSRGSEFAKNFIGDSKNHFGREWQETQPLSQFLSYVINVILTDEALFGAHPDWIKNRMQRNSDGMILFDRNETLKRFKKGEMAYRETLIGGCTNTKECDSNPLDIYHIECLVNHCKSMVGKKKKLQLCIAAQSGHVEKLVQVDSKSPDCRHEKYVLNILTETLERVQMDDGTDKENTACQ